MIVRETIFSKRRAAVRHLCSTMAQKRTACHLVQTLSPSRNS
jgi:hypothetical protein